MQPQAPVPSEPSVDTGASSEGAGEGLSLASATTARFRAAGEARDVEAMLATLSDDVVLHSPITDRVTFDGIDAMRELLRAVFAVIDDIHYSADVGDEHVRALFYTAKVGGQPLEEATRVQLNDRQQISEITIFFRPLPGLAALTSALAPRLARKHGRVRPLVASLLIGPLGLLTRLGDRLATWFT
jgi:hypothetical protein